MFPIEVALLSSISGCILRHNNLHFWRTTLQKLLKMSIFYINVHITLFSPSVNRIIHDDLLKFSRLQICWLSGRNAYTADGYCIPHAFCCHRVYIGWRDVTESLAMIQSPFCGYKKVKVKFSHTRYRALGPELIPVYMQSARRWREVNHAIYLAVVCHCFLPGLRLPS